MRRDPMSDLKVLILASFVMSFNFFFIVNQSNFIGIKNFRINLDVKKLPYEVVVIIGWFESELFFFFIFQ